MDLENILELLGTGKLLARLKSKTSSDAGKVPQSEELVPGELAVNLADRILYTKDENGEVFRLGSSDASLTSTKITDPGDIL